MAAGKRPRREEQALAALLAESTIEAAATSCGIGERTLRRWLADPEFAKRYAEARRDVLRQGIGRLVGALPKAVQVLEDVMDGGADVGDRTIPAAVRVSAARVIVSGWQDAHEADGLEERIAAIEARLADAAAKS